MAATVASLNGWVWKTSLDRVVTRLETMATCGRARLAWSCEGDNGLVSEPLWLVISRAGGALEVVVKGVDYERSWGGGRS